MASVVGDNLTPEELLALVRQLQEQNAELRRCVAALERQLAAARKNSGNSSKPPSSDIIKPPRRDQPHRRSQRKPGGQPGHPKHERAALMPDAVRVHRLKRCPDCGGRLRRLKGQDHVVQQAEIVEQPVQVTEHQAETYCCRRCGKVQSAPLPTEVEKGGLLGPGLTALVAYLKGVCHASFSTIRKFFRDVFKLPLSRGYLAKVLQKVSASLRDVYAALGARLPQEPQLNVDETGHPHAGQRCWTWCFRARDFVLFKVAESRGSEVLWDMLGEDFAGVLGCDYFSAYRKYMRQCDVRVQFCLAHLIRELKYMATLPDRKTVVYAGSLLMALREMFQVIHRRDQMTPAGFVRALARRRDVIVAMATRDVPDTSEARNLAERFRKHGTAYFQFITTPDVPPTNNWAEQAIRFVVIDRHVTQGTRSEAGRIWCERIWTVLATCAQQGRSAFQFIHSAVQAFFNQQSPPILVANTS